MEHFDDIRVQAHCPWSPLWILEAQAKLYVDSQGLEDDDTLLQPSYVFLKLCTAKPELTLEPAIAKVIAQQLAVMTAQATALADLRITELTADIELIANAGRATEETNQRLTEQLGQAQSQVQQLTGQLTQRSAEIEATRLDASKQIQTLQTSVEHERQLAQGFRDDLMRAQFKLESFADLQANLAALKIQLQDAERAAALSSQEAAVAQAKLTAQLERGEEARIRELALINRAS